MRTVRTGKLGDSTVRLELEAKGSKLPQPILAMTEKDFLRVDLRTNMSDAKLMAERMHAQGWTKRSIAGDIEKNVDFRFLEKATGKTKMELSAW